MAAGLREIGIAFLASTIASILLLTVNEALAAAAYGVVFPTVLAYLEKVKPQPAATDAPEKPAPKVPRPPIAWKWVLGGAALSTVLIALTFVFGLILGIFLALTAEAWAPLILPLPLAALVLFGVGYFIAKRSENGVINASIMGSIVGVGVTLLLLGISDGTDAAEFVYAFLVFTGSGLFSAKPPILCSSAGWHNNQLLPDELAITYRVTKRRNVCP